MVTVVEELERALQLASGNLGNVNTTHPLCPPGPVEPPGPSSLFRPPKPHGTRTPAATAPPGSHTSRSSLNSTQLGSSPTSLFSSSNNHSIGVAEVKSEPAVEVEEPRDHPVKMVTEKGLSSKFRMMKIIKIIQYIQVEQVASRS